MLKLDQMKRIFYLIGYNTFVQILGKIVSTILGFISVGLLTRYLGQEGFGNYSLTFAYLSIFGILADFGLQLTMVRELAKKTQQTRSIYGTYFWLKIILLVFSTLLAYFFLLFLPYSKFLKIAIIIASLGVGVGVLNNYGMVIFQANLRLDLLTFVDVLIKIVTITFIAVLVLLKRDFYSILNTILIGNLVGSLLIIILLKKFITFNFQFDYNLAKKIIYKSLPIGLITILSLLYFKIDTLILSIFKAPSEIGIYSLAYKVLENILVLWGYYLATVYPLLASLVKKQEEKFWEIWRRSNIIAVEFGLILIVSGYVFAPLLIRILGGKGFEESVLALRILLFSVPLFFINNLFYHLFLVKERIKELLATIASSLILNFILNIIFIPKWGYIAAAFNTLLTEGYVLTGYFFIFQTLRIKEKWLLT